MTVREYYERDPLDKRKEDLHQVDISHWISYWYPGLYWFHPVNENALPGGKQYFVRLAEKGLRKGVVDIVILHRGVNGEPFGVIELKRATKSISSPVSQEQRACLNNADNQGAFSAVAYGFKSAKLAIMDMLGQPWRKTD